MSKLLAFAGSNSTKSINFKLVEHTASLIADKEVRTLNMSQISLPVFSEDLEKEEGYAPIIKELLTEISQVEGLIVSVNEHNGYPSAFFKNVLDWLSRVDRSFLKDKKVLLMATSKGRGGALNSLEATQKLFTRFGGEVVATFSLPSFNYTFTPTEGITDVELKQAHQTALGKFLSKI